MGSLGSPDSPGSWLGVGGAVLFVVVFVVDGWTRPGYSAVRHPVSALALGRRGWVQTANFLLCGAAVTVGAVDLSITGPSTPLGIVLVVFGLGLVASGVFPMDPMLGYPPGAPTGIPAEHTVRHRLHDHAGAVVFFSLPAATAIGALTLPDLAWQLVSGAAAIALFTATSRFAKAWEARSARIGLIQRAVIIPGWAWLAAVFAL
ncbi:DUF998 domain-containing protein [Saccharomonospora sp. CUA-673]|uniref:DUF998 domain-containing protein n=1 Tax=Saccharomonospora sp. CUA-673 TaxID=1904969 RepID=UPI0021019E83|nr:DUF998 domain-containing protein [Saccharomonospora sp. CUA-673]